MRKWNLEKCKERCFVCESGGKGNCRRNNVNYEIECMQDGCKYVYLGETCRNAYCRGQEHMKGLERRDSESVLCEHVIECHNSDFTQPPCHQYKMSVTQCHDTALDRLVTEAVKIDLSTRPTLNRKKGFRSNHVLRLRTSLSRNTSNWQHRNRHTWIGDWIPKHVVKVSVKLYVLFVFCPSAWFV